MTDGHHAALLRSARTLGVDRVAGDVSGALAEAGIDAMLAKGAAVTRLLYDDGTPRRYVDCDLLVRSRDVARAGAVLAGLGFARGHDVEEAVPAYDLHAQTWVRGTDRAHVDLHWTFVGFGAALDAVFDALWAGGERDWIGGRELVVPSAAATALLAALQLLRHGLAEHSKHRVDVERALERLGEETWREAARLAGELDAAHALGAALRLTTGGAELAARLGLPDDPLARALAGGTARSEHVRRLESIAGARGVAAKLHMLAWLAFPPRSYLAVVHPWARRGGVWLVLAHIVRPLVLAARAPADLNAWRRARKEAHG